MDGDNKHLPAHVPRDLTHVLKLTNAAVNFTTVYAIAVSGQTPACPYITS